MSVQAPGRDQLSRWQVTCSKCNKTFLSSQDYHMHIQTGYPCGPVTRA